MSGHVLVFDPPWALVLFLVLWAGGTAAAGILAPRRRRPAVDQGRASSVTESL